MVRLHQCPHIKFNYLIILIMQEFGERKPPQTEKVPKLPTPIFHDKFREVKAAFHGDGDIPSLFSWFPTSDSTTRDTVEHLNGNYEIIREERKSKEELILSVVLTPKEGDTSFVSESIILSDTLVEAGEKRELEFIQKVNLVRRRSLKYVKVAKKTPQELAREEETGNKNLSQDAMLPQITESFDQEALSDLTRFIAAIREGNLNIGQKTD
jgi:hypothetical protein